MMGFSFNEDDSPVMCFNAAKSFQLGWYADKAITVSPFDSSWTGRVMGIADYDNIAGYNVLLKIETDQDVDFYLNFNRKTGINSGTVEGGDKVLVTTQGRNGAGYSDSQLVATISTGSSYTISNFGNSGKSVRIFVKEINLSASPAYADVTVSPSCSADSQCRQTFSGACSQDNWVCDRSTNFCALSNQANTCNCDYSCDDQFETAEECPSDCGQRIDLLTTVTANNGQSGNAFDIKALREIQIIGFEIHTRNAGTIVNAQVFTKQNSYEGFENNADAWTLSQSVAIESKGSGKLTPLPFLPKPLVVPRGTIRAFYITVDSGDIRYTNGNNLGAVYASDRNLEFFEGVGVVYPFSTTYSSRIWNGRIKYVQADSGPVAPTARPTAFPTARPTPESTPPQSPIRTLETTMNQNNGQGGCMFQVKALRELEIIGFEIHSRKTGNINAEVFERAGQYVGFERNATAWNRIQIAVTASKGLNNLTPLPLLPVPVRIPRGAVMSFYVTLDTNNMRYTNGNTTGALFASDGNLEFFEGSGNIYPFGTPYSPRVFNGHIKYRLVLSTQTTQSPTAAPTVTADLQEFSTIEPMSSSEPSEEPSTRASDMTSSEPPSMDPSQESLEPSADLTQEPTMHSETPSEELFVESSAPSDLPSNEPSLSIEPSIMPSTEPSMSLAPSEEPSIDPPLTLAPTEKSSKGAALAPTTL